MPDFSVIAYPQPKRLWAALAACLALCASGLPMPVHAAANDKTETTKGDLEQVKEKIQQLANALKASRVAKQDAHEALKASETAISSSRKKLREIQDAQQDNRGKLQDLQKQLSLLQRQVNQQRHALSEQLNQQYRHGNNSPLQMLLQQQDPANTTRNLKYLGYLTAAHQQQIQSLQDNQEAIDRVRSATTEQLHETERLANQYSETTQKLEGEKSRRTEALNELSKQMKRKSSRWCV